MIAARRSTAPTRREPFADRYAPTSPTAARQVFAVRSMAFEAIEEVL
jgi:hypothetical protein